VFQVGLARLRFSSGNPDVMVSAHCFSLSLELAQILRCRYRVPKRLGKHPKRLIIQRSMADSFHMGQGKTRPVGCRDILSPWPLLR
jgi:hypothetical protein